MSRLARRPTLRTLGAIGSIAGLAALGAPATPAAAAVPTPVEQQLLGRVARARTAHGLKPYRVGGAITSVAREQARRMADTGTLHHNPQLTTDVKRWRHVGENVGQGPDPVTIHHALMASPAHRANILSRSYTRVGVGAVVRDDGIWVAEVFKTPR